MTDPITRARVELAWALTRADFAGIESGPDDDADVWQRATARDAARAFAAAVSTRGGETALCLYREGDTEPRAVLRPIKRASRGGLR